MLIEKSDIRKTDGRRGLPVNRLQGMVRLGRGFRASGDARRRQALIVPAQASGLLLVMACKGSL